MCAILIPYVTTPLGDCLLMEVRSALVPQPGEVCFPGGKIEKGENAVTAALRETCEELGLDASTITILHSLPPEQMEDGREIFPIKARISESSLKNLRLSSEEVSKTFLLPLSWLQENPPKIFQLPAPDVALLPPLLQGYLSHYAPFTNTHTTYYWEYEGHGIWGMTARVINRLLSSMS
ncbi:NUDIX domain-containing protein [Lachnospiraceae bacterium XBB1006]|nr:NUDIX domain-containing protein [Lachnospiraceae bacterium XBB1006]